MQTAPVDPRILAKQNIEIWRPVPDTDFEASNLGRMRNSKSGKFVGTCQLKNGYFSLPRLLVHRAVLIAFDGAQPTSVLGRHLDGNRGNNRLDNLAWGSRQENAQDTARTGRLRGRSGDVAPVDPAVLDSIVQQVYAGTLSTADALCQAQRSAAWLAGRLRALQHPPLKQRSNTVHITTARELAARGEELWAPAVGLSNLEVSNLGRVRNPTTGRISTPAPERQGGYVRVHGASLHRVVLLSFDDPPFADALVRHTPNHDRTDNRLCNLQWGTYADNGKDTREQGRSLQGEKHPNAVLTAARVEEGLQRYIAEGWTTQQCADFLGIDQGHVASIITGKHWKQVPRPEALKNRPDQRSGGAHHLSKLTDEKVSEGLRLAATHGWGAPRLATFLGVSVATGTQILSGKTWKHLARPQAPDTTRLGGLLRHVHALTHAITQGRRLGDDEALITREEMLLVGEEAGKEAIREQLLPAVVACLQTHVRVHGWFYPPAEDTPESVLAQLGARAPTAALSASNNAGNAFLFAHFPSFWHAADGPAVAFHSATALTYVVAYRMGLGKSKPYTYGLSDGRQITTEETFEVSLKTIRRGFVVQRKSVSFFKPLTAAGLYARALRDFATPVVWDPSCGFGARMLGFASVFARGTYYGNEPATATLRDLQALATQLKEACPNLHIQLDAQGSEFTQPFADASLDFVFTSPPYFDLEQYVDEPTQCWRAYPTVDAWYTRYLVPTLREAWRGLKPGRVAVFNVDTKREPLVLRAAQEVGFLHETTEQLTLGADPFQRARGNAEVRRTEPVLFFRKPDVGPRVPSAS